jgi:hypothetical protein
MQQHEYPSHKEDTGEPVDNTTEDAEQSPPEDWPQTGSYYYDDSTGYEVFNLETEEDEEEGT